jgi:WS/DGAT/MGAT family acyltransferase
MPPAASTGVGATASITWGHSTIAADLAGVAAALGALGDDDVDAGLLVLEGAGRRAAQRGDQAAGLVDLVDHVGGRRAERVGDQLHLRVLERDVDLRRGGGRRPAEQLHRALSSPSGQLGHAVVGEQLGGELAVLLRDHLRALLELLRVELAHALVLAGDDDVDAVGLVADVLVDPVELDLELLGLKPTAPSTPKPPALLTAATTSRQWVKAKIGNSMPSSSQSGCAATELLADQLARRVALPLQIVRGVRALLDEAESIRDDALVRLRALRDLAGYAIKSASETPLNGPLGSHRYLDWLAMDLAEVKAVRRALGCTVNDVVLATVTGAVRKYMIRRRVDPERLDFRVSAPVSVRRDEDRGKLGNKVSSWIVPLPIERADPIAQLRELNRRTEELKRSNQALGVEMLMAAAEWAPAQLISLGARATSAPINMIVTNVPGPQAPLYLMGAELLEMYPQVPLLANTGLGIALVSYNGRMFWGFNCDPDLVPDVAQFVQEIRGAFKALRKAASLRAVAVAKPEAPALRPETAEPAPGLVATGASRRGRVAKAAARKKRSRPAKQRATKTKRARNPR